MPQIELTARMNEKAGFNELEKARLGRWIAACVILSLPLLSAIILNTLGIQNNFADLLNKTVFQIIFAVPVQLIFIAEFCVGIKSLRAGGILMDAPAVLGTLILSALGAYNSFFYPNAAMHASIGEIGLATPAVIITLLLLGRYIEASIKMRVCDIDGANRHSGNGKARIEKIANAVSVAFALAAIGIAIAVATGWRNDGGNLRNAVAIAACVLIAACPRTFITAVSAAIAVGIGKAVGNGILIKGGEQLENASKVGAAAFDKSGTVTQGRPEVTDAIAFPGFFREELLAFAAAAEENSEHPLAAAILEYVQPKVIVGRIKENTVRSGNEEISALYSETHGFIGSALPPTEAFEQVDGYGVRAVVGGRKVLIGTRGFLSENGIDIRKHEEILAKLEDDGKTVMAVAIQGKAAGVIAAADQVRDTCGEAVEKLKSMGVEAYMLTGDSVGTADVIANQAGIRHVLAGIPAQDKYGEIERLRSRYKAVAMVGADAPALISADTGIAFIDGDGTASEAADIALISDDLNEVSAAIRVSKTVMRKIKQNLFLAIFYNIAGISLAASGFVHPVIAGAAASAFSAFIAARLLSLKNFKI